jgi:DNA-binding CsgD family transcriptional regulator
LVIVDTAGDAPVRGPVTVVVGVDGAGRTHRLEQLASATGAKVVRVERAADPGPSLAAVLDAGAAGATIIVDDAHRLAPRVLTRLTAAAVAGTGMILARRPTVTGPELAELDAVLASRGEVEMLGPLDDVALAALLGVADRPRIARLRRASCGLAAVAVHLVSVPEGEPPPALVARVQRRIATLDTASAHLARLLSLHPGLPDDVLPDAAGLDPGTVAESLKRLREEGLSSPQGEGMIPAVAALVVAELSPAHRRLLHDAVARALLDRGGDLLPAAVRLRQARARTPCAALVFGAVGEKLRFDDPYAALDWLDEAAGAGLDPGRAAPPRAEAALLLGTFEDVDLVPAGRQGTERTRRVEGVLAARAGRAGRAADLLLDAGHLGRALAVPSLVAVGRMDEARLCAGAPAPPGLRRLAEAALAVTSPDSAVPLFIEASEVLARERVEVVLPDTPAGLAAPVAVLAGDAATAEALLDEAIAAGTGGPAAQRRHRLLLAWVRLRTGRLREAAAGPAGGGAYPGREHLLSTALEAGLARRRGDIARLRSLGAVVERILARRAVDVLHLEVLEELLVAAARLRAGRRIAPVLDILDSEIRGLGDPCAWRVCLGWARLQVAIATGDAGAVASEAARLEATDPAGPRQRAQRQAATHWADVLAGRVDAESLVIVLDALVAAQLPWEASRLAGQAAIRAADAAVARRLLERARELSGTRVAREGPRPAVAADALSRREAEIARLVVEGSTHREIGGQLYLSPKTVEHHVARIRTKLGATTRAELLAALRDVLGEEREGR